MPGPLHRRNPSANCTANEVAGGEIGPHIGSRDRPDKCTDAVTLDGLKGDPVQRMAQPLSGGDRIRAFDGFRRRAVLSKLIGLNSVRGHDPYRLRTAGVARFVAHAASLVIGPVAEFSIHRIGAVTFLDRSRGTRLNQ